MQVRFAAEGTKWLALQYAKLTPGMSACAGSAPSSSSSLAAFFALLGARPRCMVVEEAQELWARGQATEGTLTAHHGRRKSNMREYSYTYRVGAASSPPSAAHPVVRARAADRLEASTVRYDPADPERSVTPAELEENGKWINQAIFFVIAAGFLGWAVRRIVDEEELQL